MALSTCTHTNTKPRLLREIALNWLGTCSCRDCLLCERDDLIQYRIPTIYRGFVLLFRNWSNRFVKTLFVDSEMREISNKAALNFYVIHTYRQTLKETTVLKTFAVILTAKEMWTELRYLTSCTLSKNINVSVFIRRLWRLLSVICSDHSSCVLWCSCVCFQGMLDFLVINFPHQMVPCAQATTCVKAWPVVFFFNKSRGEVKQAGDQSSCQDLSVWLSQFIGGRFAINVMFRVGKEV